MRTMPVVVGILAMSGALAAQGCNPEAAAMKIIREQGLVVLKPARSYIRVGGIVSVKQNAPRYRDPLDPVPTDNNPDSNVRQIVMAQSAKSSTNVGLALKGLGSIIPIPVGLNVGADRQVSLAQTNTSGVRIPSAALDAQILKPNTAAKIRELLNGGSKVYLVEEVHSGTSIDLAASNKTALIVSLGGAALEQCGAAKEDGKEKGAGDAKSDETKKAETSKPGESGKPADSNKPLDASKPADTSKGCGSHCEHIRGNFWAARQVSKMG
jgi:hypothetical protein